MLSFKWHPTVNASGSRGGEERGSLDVDLRGRHLLLSICRTKKKSNKEFFVMFQTAFTGFVSISENFFLMVWHFHFSTFKGILYIISTHVNLSWLHKKNRKISVHRNCLVMRCLPHHCLDTTGWRKCNFFKNSYTWQMFLFRWDISIHDSYL